MRVFDRIKNDRRVPKNYQEDTLHVTEIITALLEDGNSAGIALEEFSGPELWDALKILTKLQMDTRLPNDVRTDKEVDDMAQIIREMIKEKKYLAKLDENDDSYNFLKEDEFESGVDLNNDGVYDIDNNGVALKKPVLSGYKKSVSG